MTIHKSADVVFKWIVGLALFAAGGVTTVAVGSGVRQALRFARMSSEQRDVLGDYRAESFDLGAIQRNCRPVDAAQTAIRGSSTMIYVSSESFLKTGAPVDLDVWSVAVKRADSHARMIVAVWGPPETLSLLVDHARTSGMPFSACSITDPRTFRGETGVRVAPAVLLLDARGSIVAASVGTATPDVISRFSRRLSEGGSLPVLFEVARDGKILK